MHSRSDYTLYLAPFCFAQINLLFFFSLYYCYRRLPFFLSPSRVVKIERYKPVLFYQIVSPDISVKLESRKQFELMRMYSSAFRSDLAFYFHSAEPLNASLWKLPGDCDLSVVKL